MINKKIEQQKIKISYYYNSYNINTEQTYRKYTNREQ